MKQLAAFLLSIFIVVPVAAQFPQYSASMIRSHGEEWSAGKAWDYVSGLVTKTILMYCSQYPDDEFSNQAYGWCKVYADNAIDANGNFYNFKKGSLDNIASGKVLFDLYAQESSENPAAAERYRKAADYLYNYLHNDYVRINLEEGEGGFIHKDSYPYQMWLDGLYMGGAFYAEYLSVFAPDDYEAWADIARQFNIIHSHTYDSEKSLCYHGWSAYSPVAIKAYDGLLNTFITESAAGIDINHICRSAGLGPSNKKERNGTADYYLDGSDVNIVSNEGKGIGSFIMASLEYEKFAASAVQSATADPSSPVAVYDILGRPCSPSHKGIIIEIRDGIPFKHLNK